MFVRMLEAVAGRHFSYPPGKIVELDDEQARKWIECGTCESADPHEATNNLETAVREAPEKAVTRGRFRKP